jgi:hypothetical protein
MLKDYVINGAPMGIVVALFVLGPWIEDWWDRRMVDKYTIQYAERLLRDRERRQWALERDQERQA